MSEHYCTICSKEKSEKPGLMPAINRYDSIRIKSVGYQAQEKGQEFLILSGKYGLIDARQPIPWYDHLLVAEEVEKMVAIVTQQLRDLKVQSLTFYTADEKSEPSWRPYCEVIRQSTSATGVRLTMKTI